MRQTLHIFKKDVRHLQREIILMLALAAIFCWVEAHTSILGPLSDALEPLFIAAEGYTIAQLIHAEALPGENQFWITRPYRWQSLLAAKLLFIVTFMNLPVLAAQAIILIRDGFPIASIVPGLLWTQVLILICVLLPLAALATLTDSMVQFIGSPLATAFVVFVIFYFWHWYLIDTPTGVEWLRDAILFIGLAAIVPPVLYLQYKFRWTRLSRAVAMGIAIFIAAVYLSISWRTLFPIQSHLSKQNADAVRVALDPTQKFQLRPGGEDADRAARWRVSGGQFQLVLPIVVSGLPDRSRAQFEAFGIRLEAPGGRALRLTTFRMHIEKSALRGGISLDPDSLAAESGRPLTLRASFHLTLFGNPREKTIMLHSSPQLVMDALQCYDGGFNELECRSPFRWPNRLVAQTSPIRNPLTGLISYSPFPANLQLDPIVRKAPVYYSATPLEAERQVTIEVEEPLAYLRREVEVRDIRLNPK